MNSTRRSKLLAWLLLGALAAACGCATSGSSQEDETLLKQAKSNFEIGIDHMDHGRYALALRALLDAERLDPKNARIHVALAEAYMHRGKVDEAESHLLQALDIYAAYHDARLNLSALYLMTGRYAEAAEHSRILVDDPTFPATWRALTNLGVAELGRGDLEEARKNLQLAYEYNRAYWPALLSLGTLAKREGRTREAIEYFEQALAQHPTPNARAEVNYRLAEVYVSLGKRQQAMGHLMTAVAQSPHGEWGKKSEEYLKILR
jgi:Tfp pilus assembly protein PilF